MEDKQSIIEIFEKSKSISDVLKKMNLCNNSKNWKYIKDLMVEYNFDVNIYKKRKEHYCECCGNILNNKQKKFCSKSCSAKITNKNKIKSDETKYKISQKLKQFNNKTNIITNDIIKIINDEKCLNKNKEKHICLNCNNGFETKKKKQSFCSIKCSSIYNNNRSEVINKLSKSRINKIIEGKVNNYGIKMEYFFNEKIIKCDSKIEYSCLNYFERKGATEIERCDFYIKYDDNGKNRRYNPDFKIKINEDVYIVECKSYISSNNLNEKWHNYNENSILKKELLKK